MCPHCVLEQALLGKTSDAADLPPDAQRDLIFCLFAVQLGCATADQFVVTGVAWLSEPERGLSTRLIEACNIEPDRVVLLDGLTDAAIKHHGGDIHSTLTGLSIDRTLEDIFDWSVDSAPPEDPTRLGLPLALNIGSSERGALSEDPGRYTHKSEYSRGGMGRILLVHDQYLARDVALKELLPDRLRMTPKSGGESTPFSKSAGMIARFLREAKITGQLEHPNIVPVYELGQREGGNFYYTMKLIRGETFAAALKKSEGLRDRLRLIPNFVDLVQAIAYAHSRQVVHRDLKPGNVMLGPFGETVVIDWGLAKIVGTESEVDEEMSSSVEALRDQESVDGFETRDGARLGTPAYMSPEQARGEIAKIDGRSDVYSLGAMLYEILTGEPPFGRLTVVEMLDRIATSDVPSPDEKASGAPPELGAICAKALRLDPSERYEDASGLLADLQNFISGALVSAHDYSAREMISRFYENNKDVVRVSLAGALSIVALVAYSYMRISDERDAAVAARDQVQIVNYSNAVKLAQSFLDDENFEAANELLRELPEKLHGWEWSHLWNRANPVHTSIRDVSVGRWFSDSRRVLLVGRNGLIRVYDVVTDEELLAIETESVRTTDIALNPAETMVAHSEFSPRITLYDLVSGLELRELIGHRGIVFGVRFSPDGAYLISQSLDGTAKVWDVDSGENLWTVSQSGFEPATDLAFLNSGRTLVLCLRDVSSQQDSTQSHVVFLDLETGEMGSGPQGVLISVDTESDRLYTRYGEDIRVYSPSISESYTVWSGHNSPVWKGQPSSNNEILYTIAENGEFFAWDTQSGTLRRQSKFSESARDIRIFPESHRGIVIDEVAHTFGLWDFERGYQYSSWEGNTQVVHDVEISPDGRFALGMCFDQVARVWSGSVLSAFQRFPVGDYVGHLNTMSSAGDHLLVYGSNYTAIVLEGPELSPVLGLVGGISRANAISPTGDRVAFRVGASSVGVIDVEQRALLGVYDLHRSTITHIEWRRDGADIVSADWQGAIHRWDPDTFEQLSIATVSSVAPTSLALAPEGGSVVVSTEDGGVFVWSGQSESEAARVGDLRAPVVDSVVSGDGGWLVLGDESGYLYGLVMGSDAVEPLGQAHSGSIMALAFGEKGDRLVVCGNDGIQVRSWPALRALTDIGMPADPVSYMDLALDESTDDIYSLDGGFVTRWFSEVQTVDIAGDATNLEIPVLSVVPTGAIDIALARALENDSLSTTVGERDSFRSLGLLEGDVIVRIGDSSIEDEEGLAAAIRSVQALPDTSDLTVTVRRKNLMHEYQFIALDPISATLVLAASEEDVRGALNSELRTLAESDALVAMLNRGYYYRNGLVARKLNGGLSEGIVMSRMSSLENKYLSSVGLAPDDRLTAIQGVPIDSIERLQDIIENLLEELDAGELDEITTTVERGELLTLEVSVSITNN